MMVIKSGRETMILRPLCHHSTSEFHWDPETKTFSADASELRWPNAPLTEVLGRCYDDACDIGFTLESTNTGKLVTVAIEKEDANADYSGGWSRLEFVPCERAMRNAFKVVVFND